MLLTTLIRIFAHGLGMRVIVPLQCLLPPENLALLLILYPRAVKEEWSFRKNLELCFQRLIKLH